MTYPGETRAHKEAGMIVSHLEEKTGLPGKGGLRLAVSKLWAKVRGNKDRVTDIDNLVSARDVKEKLRRGKITQIPGELIKNLSEDDKKKITSRLRAKPEERLGFDAHSRAKIERMKERMETAEVVRSGTLSPGSTPGRTQGNSKQHG